MGIGYAEPKRLTLGAGDIYINDVFVGNVKGVVDFKYTPSYAFQRPGNSIVDVKGERTLEECTLGATICDFKVAQLRRAFGINQAILSGSLTVRKQDILLLSGTVAASTSDTMVPATLKVSKLDRSVAYVSGTDYTASATQVTRKVGGVIAAGQNVIVEYDFIDIDANAVQVGGEKTTPNTFTVEFSHKLSNGKYVGVTLYKAMVIGGLDLNFAEKSSGNYTVHKIEFKALADITRLEGKNLFEIVEEDPLTAS